MPLVPNFQIYPASLLDLFQISFSRFYGSRLQIVRYASSFSSKSHNFFVNQNKINSDSIPEKYPPRKSDSVQKTQNDRWPFAEGKSISQPTSNGGFSSQGWIEKWSEALRPKLPKQPQDILDYRYGTDISSEDDEQSSSSTSTSTRKMVKIVQKLKRFGFVDNVHERKERVPEKGSVEDIFYVEDGMLPNSRGGFSVESPLGFEYGFGGVGNVQFLWENPLVKEEDKRNSVRQQRTSVAELTLPEFELKRLRHLAFQIKQRTKIGGAGITQAVVDLIHEKWKMSEVVRLKCEAVPSLNMTRMHDILERKTGGLVIWRSGTSVSLYRGVGYEFPSMQQARKINHTSDINSCATTICRNSRDPMASDSDGDMQLAQGSLVSVKETKEVESLPVIKYENEIDKLLNGLGPRYTDWPGCDPLPVDADLLPGVVPDYKPPFRILPYGVKSSLGLKEATALRRLARILPPHFALGRNRQHQGLAMAIVKLWERSSIAKIALKHGIQLNISKMMAEDIKKLIGGILLSRNKDFIVFYRGKNFLSSDVTEALLERERFVKTLQDEDEQAQLRASSLFIPSVETIEESVIADTLGESLEASARRGKRLDNGEREMVVRAAEVERHANLVRRLERKLAFGKYEVMKLEWASAKVEAFLKPGEWPTDQDSITDKERLMFRKIGLTMKVFIFLGRHGVLDDMVENMHLHWKYRELVKIIVKSKTFDQVRNIALLLEVESGGILVSIDKVPKGFAIIVFRGKDYQRPRSSRPSDLLAKRKVLAHSIELQKSEDQMEVVED